MQRAMMVSDTTGVAGGVHLSDGYAFPYVSQPEASVPYSDSHRN